MSLSTPVTPSASNRPFVHCSTQSLFSLSGRTVVITGGARGLGLAWAFAVAEYGGNVAVLDYSDDVDDDFHLLAQRYPKQSFRSYKVDVTQAEVVQSTIDKVVADFGYIDGLITAAGICVDEPFTERAPASVARSFNVNVLGTYFAAQSVARQMKKQNSEGRGRRGGSIVFVGSHVASVGSEHQSLSDYSATKGAVVALAKVLGYELAPFGIRVNSVSPGHTLTDMTKALMTSSPHLAKSFTTNPPLGRIGDLVDLKGVMVYLLSDASAYQTGEDVIIAGGLNIGRTSRPLTEEGGTTEASGSS